MTYSSSGTGRGMQGAPNAHKGPNCQTDGPKIMFLKSRAKLIISQSFDIVGANKSVEAVGTETPYLQFKQSREFRLSPIP